MNKKILPHNRRIAQKCPSSYFKGRLLNTPTQKNYYLNTPPYVKKFYGYIGAPIKKELFIIS